MAFNHQALKVGRCFRAMSIKQLSEKSGIYENRISALEFGTFAQPTNDEILKIVDCLKFPKQFFFDSDIEFINHFSLKKTKTYNLIYKNLRVE